MRRLFFSNSFLTFSASYCKNLIIWNIYQVEKFLPLEWNTYFPEKKLLSELRSWSVLLKQIKSIFQYKKCCATWRFCLSILVIYKPQQLTRRRVETCGSSLLEIHVNEQKKNIRNLQYHALTSKNKLCTILFIKGYKWFVVKACQAKLKKITNLKFIMQAYLDSDSITSTRNVLSD